MNSKPYQNGKVKRQRSSLRRELSTIHGKLGALEAFYRRQEAELRLRISDLESRLEAIAPIGLATPKVTYATPLLERRRTGGLERDALSAGNGQKDPSGVGESHH